MLKIIGFVRSWLDAKLAQHATSDPVERSSRRSPELQKLKTDLDAAQAEIVRLRDVNRRLHRRAQQVEGPAISHKQQLAYLQDSLSRQWLGEFNRVLKAFNEVQRIFLELTRAYEYPLDGRSRHSVMDSDVERNTGFGEGVYANCFISQQGGVQSFRVLDEVRRAVEELLELRRNRLPDLVTPGQTTTHHLPADYDATGSPGNDAMGPQA